MPVKVLLYFSFNYYILECNMDLFLIRKSNLFTIICRILLVFLPERKEFY
ncbi:hypothetical protein A1OE_361 [Candidatus Endolissoclinum faulkneri L2]|uniref:Uncharacterized protein n=1 Tax=Candidatus Endolissoclinum faulkneri L2 TaxID=1193729 RepID=K7ZCG5_9PROT|nr:hypothetical protein A1OE_361 [Candidatus Endolissoclinum faulkneri L2]